jgi:purine-nucleoside phosphorylase
VLEGRVHLYEGLPVEVVQRPARILSGLGVNDLILTNAAGSLSGEIPPGSLMRATDGIDLFFLRMGGGRADPGASGRDRRSLFDPILGREIDEAARLARIPLHRGILGGVLGPAYETAAEVALLRRAGVDAACMSTIPEGMAASRSGMRVAAVSLIANYATGLARGRTDHAEVLERAGGASGRIEKLLRAWLSRKGKDGSGD